MKLLLAALFAVLAPSCRAEQTCGLQFPPRAAVVTAGHGFYFFIYPNGIPKKFTGCQTVWTESGHEWIVYRFKNGSIEQVTVDYPQPAQPGNISFDCHFSGGKALERDKKECLTAEQSKGFPRQGPIPALIPPPEKDPRRES
ncbi:MAG TPA: hypothetical protein VGF27_06795 [Pseudoduganella sp.]